MNLSELKQNTPHPLKPIFSNYALGQIAKKLNIHTTYLSNVLTGFSRPGPKLRARLESLAEEILKAEQQGE